MTGARELAQLTILSAAPEQVRLSVLGGNTQVDLSLPLDAPIASLLPEIARLVRSREAQRDQPEDGTAKEAKRDFWVLCRADGDQSLSPDSTLRESGIVSGSLLRLTAERALAAPTLYDDVVDAAARLNRAGYASWGPAAARATAYLGVHLASLCWLYFLVADVFAPHRGVMVGLSAVVTVTLVGIAALANRSYGQPVVATALGWATIPVTVGIAWAALHRYGGYGLAAGCVALIVVFVLYHRAIGTGRWAFLTSWVILGFGGVSLVLVTVGLRADHVGCGVAVVASVACLVVSRATASLARFALRKQPAESEPERSLFENPFEQSATQTPPTTTFTGAEPGEPIPTAEAVWARVRLATATRSGWYGGLAVSAAIGAVTVLNSQAPVHWSGFVFALATAAALAVYSRRTATGMEAAALLVPAAGLFALTCWLAQDGVAALPLTGFGVLLAVAVLAVVIGVRTTAEPLSPRRSTALGYVEYGITAALLPLALWVAEVYERLDIR